MRIYISAMAEKQKEIERDLKDKSANIIDRLLYIVLNPTATTVHHWESEICAFISKVPVLKGKGKFPTAKQIYEWTYLKWRDSFVNRPNTMRQMIRAAQEEENIQGDFDPDVIASQLEYICTEYFTWLSQELSTTGRVVPSDVHNEIDDLLYEVII